MFPDGRPELRRSGGNCDDGISMCTSFRTQRKQSEQPVNWTTEYRLSSMTAPEAADAAAKQRIIKHMNADHHDSVRATHFWYH